MFMPCCLRWHAFLITAKRHLMLKSIVACCGLFLPMPFSCWVQSHQGLAFCTAQSNFVKQVRWSWKLLHKSNEHSRFTHHSSLRTLSASYRSAGWLVWSWRNFRAQATPIKVSGVQNVRPGGDPPKLLHATCNLKRHGWPLKTESCPLILAPL